MDACSAYRFRSFWPGCPAAPQTASSRLSNAENENRKIRSGFLDAPVPRMLGEWGPRKGRHCRHCIATRFLSHFSQRARIPAGCAAPLGGPRLLASPAVPGGQGRGLLPTAVGPSRRRTGPRRPWPARCNHGVAVRVRIAAPLGQLRARVPPEPACGGLIAAQTASLPGSLMPTAEWAESRGRPSWLPAICPKGRFVRINGRRGRQTAKSWHRARPGGDVQARGRSHASRHSMSLKTPLYSGRMRGRTMTAKVARASTCPAAVLTALRFVPIGMSTARVPCGTGAGSVGPASHTGDLAALESAIYGYKKEIGREVGPYDLCCVGGAAVQLFSSS